MEGQRDFAVAVLGATGVTGRQAVFYLRDRAARLDAPWAIAGRDRSRLEGLVAESAGDGRPEVVAVDVADASSVQALAERSRTIVNFAGPFARLAPPVIAACVEARTHYVDVTGEIGFVARMIEQHHERAARRGVRIVQVAGIEALPFDLLTRLGIERFTSAHGSAPNSADLIHTVTLPPGVPRPSDMLSAGTVASLQEWLRSEDANVIGDPAALVRGLADTDAVRRSSPIDVGLRHSPELGVLAPMLPSPDINPPVIQRSLALAGLPPIRYRESAAVGATARSRPLQVALGAALATGNRALRRTASAPAPLRRAAATLWGTLVPHSAKGPRPDRIELWRWTIDAVISGGGEETRARVEGRGHTGYLATSRMAAEAALILADPHADVPEGGGCLTPATALGTAELERFAAAELRFDAG